MIVHLSDTHDPYYHLALMEYLLKFGEEDYLLVFENKNAIIVGRHQNTYAEVNQTFIETHKPYVVRRLAGGGTVYQDIGNICYVFITRNHFNDFLYFINPLLDVLKTYGIDAEFSGRNDVLYNGKKISGNAQSKYKDRTLHGGTILFDADLSKIEAALRVSSVKLASKGVESVRSRITNIKPYLDNSITKDLFKARFIDMVIKYHKTEKHPLILKDDDKYKIEQLLETRYKTKAWNYGKSPAYNLKKTKRFDFGQVDFYLIINKNVIEALHIFSDTLTLESLKPLEAVLTDTDFNKQTCEKVLTTFYALNPTYPILKETVLTLLFDHEERYYV